jgi:hypothetical protein
VLHPEEFAPKLAAKLSKILRDDPQMDEVVSHRDHFEEITLDGLARTLEGVATRATAYAAALRDRHRGSAKD